ncbi:class I SAM-dependent methyltransferase [Candidatus Peregrinibacteria bacterium]|nr:MAG: class I SAM-dependent methyltransferase [Candidatus Peregrinibacteria bacterium]
MHSKRIREKVKRDYNSIAEEFSETRQASWKEFEDFVPFLRSGLRVLDLGCGNGRLLGFLRDKQLHSYVGVDQSEALLEQARGCVDTFADGVIDPAKLRFVQADILNLPNLGGKFDAAFMIASFHHLPPKDQLVFLKRLKMHLKPGAFLFMTNWNLWSLRFWKAWLRNVLWPNYGFRGLLIPWKHRVKRYYYAFRPKQLRGLLEKAGYTVHYEKQDRNLITIART